MTALHRICGTRSTISVDNIIRIIRREKDRNEVVLADKSTTDMDDVDLDLLFEQPVQLLPAQPGTSICYVNDEGELPQVSRRPLIAWALCVDGCTRPLTAAGVNDGDSEGPFEGYPIEMPTGQICFTGDAGLHFANADSWLAWEIEQHERRHAERARKVEEQGAA